MRLKGKLEPEPEPGQSVGSGSSQIPRLRLRNPAAHPEAIKQIQILHRIRQLNSVVKLETVANNIIFVHKSSNTGRAGLPRAYFKSAICLRDSPTSDRALANTELKTARITINCIKTNCSSVGRYGYIPVCKKEKPINNNKKHIK